MTQMDFIMAIVITIGVISFAVYYVSDNVNSYLDQVSILELRQSADVLDTKLFDNSFLEDMNLVRARFEETTGKPHAEMITISFSRGAKDIQIYDENMKLIASGSGIASNQITFPLSMSANQVAYFNIYYTGTTGGISITGDNGISSRLLREQTVQIVSEQLCIKSDYDSIKKDFNHNFKIKLGSCEIGSEPPSGTVVAKTVPVLLKSDSIKRELANIMVW